jgi:hypothetical protein
MGPSGMGKSTLVYNLLTQLFLEGYGFALLDPHGKLYDELLRFIVYVGPRDDIRLIDATRSEVTASINPFEGTGDPDEIEAKADRLTKLTLELWASGRPDGAVRAEKILSILYVALLEFNQPLSELLSLLEYQSFDPQKIQNDFARSEWEELFSMSETQYRSYMDSVKTRIKPLTSSRIQALTNPGQALDTLAMIDGGVLLTNLAHGSGRTLAALLIAELWATAFKRNRENPPFFILIDEFENFATPEIARILSQARKFGLRMILVHQTEGQIPSYMRDAINNRSLSINFLGKGYVQVDGWGSGIHETRFDPEPIPHDTDVLRESIEHFRREVTIAKPKPVDKVVESVDEIEEDYTVPLMTPSRPIEDIDIVRELRYATVEHVGKIINPEDKGTLYNNARRRLAKLAKDKKINVFKVAGKNVYCLPGTKEPHGLNKRHELMLSDFIALVWDQIISVERKGSLDGINEDARAMLTYGAFYVEVERGNKTHEELLDKARQYLLYSKHGKHRNWCKQFRVIFVRETEAMARNLCKAIANSEINHKGKFWVSWGGDAAISPRGEAYQLTTGLTIT